ARRARADADLVPLPLLPSRARLRGRPVVGAACAEPRPRFAGAALAASQMAARDRFSHSVKLYDYAASANCYKVRLLLAQLGVEYERVPFDIFAGDTLTDEYALINPARTTPVLEDPPGHVPAGVERDPAPTRTCHAVPAGRSSGLSVAPLRAGRRGADDGRPAVQADHRSPLFGRRGRGAPPRGVVRGAPTARRAPRA